MSEVSLEQIQPFLIPDYWNGNLLGKDAPEFRPVQKGRTGKDSRESLIDYFEQLEEYRAVRTFEDGDPFDATLFSDGTIFLLNYEKLTLGRGDLPSFDENCEPANRPTELDSRIKEFDAKDWDDRSVELKCSNVYYLNEIRWGVVGTDRKTKARTLRTIKNSDIDYEPEFDEYYISRLSLYVGAASFVIGRTFSTSKHEYVRRFRYERVNVLDVCGRGWKAREPEVDRNTSLGRIGLGGLEPGIQT